MTATPDLDRLARLATRVLKDEPSARVELLGAGTELVVRKTYRNRGLRLLQTWLRRSRAEREHANLRAIERRAVPCTPPLGWQDDRHLGLVRSSTLATRFLPDSRTLKAVLAEPGVPASTRRGLAHSLGDLLARLHEGGILWCTAMPRNVLVLGDPARGALALCDAPAAIVCRGAVPSRLAGLDLFDALMSTSRRREWSGPERLRALRSYCRGDRAAARAAWRRLARRTPFCQRLRKNLSMALRTYILRAAVHDPSATAP